MPISFYKTHVELLEHLTLRSISRMQARAHARTHTHTQTHGRIYTHAQITVRIRKQTYSFRTGTCHYFSCIINYTPPRALALQQMTENELAFLLINANISRGSFQAVKTNCVRRSGYIFAVLILHTVTRTKS